MTAPVAVPASHVYRIPSKEELDAGMDEMIRLLDKWSAEDPAYDRETLPLLLAALEETRSGKWCRDS